MSGTRKRSVIRASLRKASVTFGRVRLSSATLVTGILEEATHDRCLEDQ